MLHTERMRLRPLVPQDATFILELLNSPGWLEFIGDRNVRTIEAARNYLLDRLIPGYAEKGFGFYGCELLKDQTLIGTCGMIRRPFLDHPDIGFGFLPEHMGQGYAYEASTAVMELATSRLKLEKVVAFTDLENTRSIRLLEKLGLQKVGPFSIPGEEEKLLLLEINLISS